MEWYVSSFIFVVVLLLLFATGLPIFFSLGLASFVGLVLLLGPQKAMLALGTTGYHTAHSFVIVAIPLFIFMAEVVLFSGAGKDLFAAMKRWFAGMPGGLALSTNVSCGVFAAVCGASTATAATVGVIAIPEMMKAGYDKRFTAGTVAAGGTIGILIPPSIIMILYAFITEQSVGSLFIAGVIPGIMSVGLYFLGIMIYTTIKPHWAPGRIHYSWKERLLSLRKVLAVVSLIVLVMGSIYSGLATPTEAAAVGAFGALFIAIVSRKMNWPNLRGAMLRAARTTSFIVLIVIAAKMFGLLITNLNVPQGIIEFVAVSEMSRWAVLIWIVVGLFIGGMFFSSGPLVVLTMPVLFPVVSAVGFDPIWFGIVVVICSEMATITPPVGLTLYVIAGVSERYGVTLEDCMRGVLLYLPWDFIRLTLVILFPIIALWLPGTMY